jgi:sodium/potassium/calcium exchanger 6
MQPTSSMRGGARQASSQINLKCSPGAAPLCAPSILIAPDAPPAIMTTDERILAQVQRWRRPRFSARPFALTLLAVALITVLATAKSRTPHVQNVVPRALHSADDAQNEECRLVHHARDKCAFVRANCPDEEAGVVSYLALYYCHTPHAQPVAFILMVLWLGMLFTTIGIAASDFFCINLNTISRMLGLSESLAGVTLLAFGNGSPDVFSTFAAFRTHAASLAVGELIGAACFITAVVSGSMALIRPFAVARKSFMRDVGFFLLAAAFSLGFIIDGKLQLWESVAMVTFYIFYVIVVVAWHWWINQRKTRRWKAAASRGHYVTPGGDAEDVAEYHDDEAPVVSVDDISALERAGGQGHVDEDDDEEERERWMGEMTNNMRVNRPPLGTRRSTHTPVRPSLVGALEFRAVLSSLQKSRNIQSMPISLRRYSDDPTYTTAQQQDRISSDSDPAARPAFHVASMSSNSSLRVTRPNMELQQAMGNRARAVSTNDMDSVTLRPGTLQGRIPDITVDPATSSTRPPLPADMSNTHTSQHPSRLAPPRTGTQVPPPIRQDSTPLASFSSLIPEPTERAAPPNLQLSVPGAMSPPIPFPAYTEYPLSTQSTTRPSSLRLPSPSASPQSSMFPKDPFSVHEPSKIPRWWPSTVLPPPHILVGTLFPTFANWSDKNFWDKLLGIIAGPPVFLLTITLPVVEPDRDEDRGGHAELSLDLGLPPPLSSVPGSFDSHRRSSIFLPEGLVSPGTSLSQNGTFASERTSSASNTPQVFITDSDNVAQSPEQLPTIPSTAEPKQWNRWLVVVQIFTAPLFVVLIMWANLQPDDPRALLRHALYSLLASMCMLAFILLTTTPNRPPRWRSALCFLGFAVAIAWISTIANEVVGVLRTLGVILSMSDAILGLTIFAVGNSLGDLVADITVARLGFPIMALSACFGGPMLNILLGIGLSGCYMTITKGEHRHERHPDKPVHFAPYHIAVSTTLVISGATLLFTLVGLLVAVPLRNWRMDKVIGWGLIVTWAISTFANVLVEVLGYSSDVT